jgi:hypothetical protein
MLELLKATTGKDEPISLQNQKFNGSIKVVLFLVLLLNVFNSFIWPII